MGLVEAFKKVALPVTPPVAVAIGFHQHDVAVAVARNDEIAGRCHLQKPRTAEIARKNLQPVALRQFDPLTEQSLPRIARLRPRLSHGRS